MADTLLPPPTNTIEGIYVPDGVIPDTLRKWGYFPDVDSWYPGDLLLTSSVEPDWVSKKIQQVQTSGYGVDNARFTHAAVYLGDGLMVCEAQIDPLKSIKEVRVTKLWDYLGTHEIRVRRSVHVINREIGWAIAVAACLRIGKDYDWKFIGGIALRHAWTGKAMMSDLTDLETNNKFVCSSLYSAAHAYVTGISINDRGNGICAPAYLAGTQKHLADVEFGWRKIA
ncbi:hypothetical protein [Bradyrhizobium sp. SSUT77]|uniref:hypothetical protein n=1 Tax=Bradyrhizobium sp. SSUT77 TaxID=3040603 RepID=UPI002448BEE1|nr:hypothetical protein [Bradyrhizobium sp. SSUT77]MDH2346806.1 hypothetical protein [Bradyrhizobium sp. SSUT77]